MSIVVKDRIGVDYAQTVYIPHESVALSACARSYPIVLGGIEAPFWRFEYSPAY